ncbi:hypothetical protein Tco_0326485, partial [Tanacetum coccineum]
WSPDVTLVNINGKFRNVMKCHKIPSKFAKSLTFGASISWGLETDIREKDEKLSKNGQNRARNGKA